MKGGAMATERLLLSFSLLREQGKVSSENNSLLPTPIPFEEFFQAKMEPESLSILDASYTEETVKNFLFSSAPGSSLTFSSLKPGGTVSLLLTHIDEGGAWVEARLQTEEIQTGEYDYLTRVRTRPYFFAKAEECLLKEKKEEGKQSYVLMIDLDNFKGINDSYGHIIGDLYLKNIASVLSKIFQNQLFARYGGDEFVALLLSSTPEELSSILEKIGEVKYGYEKSEGKEGVTCSVGVAVASGRGNDLLSVIEDADKDLYAKKKNRKKKRWGIFSKKKGRKGKKKEKNASLLLFREERKHRSNLYFALLFAFLIAFVGTVSGIDIAFNAEVRNQTSRVASSLMESRAESISSLVRSRSEECFHGLSNSSSSVLDYPYSGDNGEFASGCLDALALNPYIDNPGLLLSNGNALLSGDSSYDLSYTELAESLILDKKESVERVSVLFKEDQIVFGYPLQRQEYSEKDGTISIAGILSFFKLSDFASKIELETLDSSFLFALTDEEGNVIVSRVKDGYKEFAPYSNLVDGFYRKKEFVTAASLKENLRKDKACLEEISYSGGTYLYSSPMGVSSWRLLIFAPHSYFYAYISSFALFATLGLNLLSGAFLVISLFGFFYLKKLKMSSFDARYIDPVTRTITEQRFFLDEKTLRKRNGTGMVVAVLNIRSFNFINDRLGSEGGDALLGRIAILLQAQLFRSELLSRANSDRFLLLLNPGSEEEISARISSMLDQVDKNLPKEGHVTLSWSTGACRVEDMDTPTWQIVDHATSACEKSAISGEDSRLCFFDEAMKKTSDLEAYIEQSQELALQEGQFLVYYQPKYDLKAKRFGGAEALVRWKDPERGFLPTQTFVDVFEQNGFINKLDLYVFEQVLSDMRVRFAQKKEVLVTSINISRVHFQNPDFFSEYEALIERYGIPGKYLEFEITESIALNSSFDVNSLCKRIHALGAEVSIDDFGSGFSNLALINRVDYDVLKMDRKLLFGKNGFDRYSKQILKMVCSLNKELGKKVVCEGVEHKEESDFLSSIGCDLIQGYYYAKPMPKAELSDLLDKNK